MNFGLMWVRKRKKYRLIYADDRATAEIVAYVWGKCNLQTARRLRRKLKDLGVSYDTICSDDWKAFKTAFQHDNHLIGKQHTKGIEGNNCRLRHRISRAFRNCFSKKLFNHLKAFRLAFFYINFGYEVI